MPTLIRLSCKFAIVSFGGYVAMLALANFIEPRQREIVVTIPLHSGVHVRSVEPVRAKTRLATSGDERLFDALQNLPLIRD